MTTKNRPVGGSNVSFFFPPHRGHSLQCSLSAWRDPVPRPPSAPAPPPTAPPAPPDTIDSTCSARPTPTDTPSARTTSLVSCPPQHCRHALRQPSACCARRRRLRRLRRATSAKRRNRPRSPPVRSRRQPSSLAPVIFNTRPTTHNTRFKCQRPSLNSPGLQLHSLDTLITSSERPTHGQCLSAQRRRVCRALGPVLSTKSERGGRYQRAKKSLSASSHSLHQLLLRWCSQMPPPMQSLHGLRSRWWGMLPAPTHSLHRLLRVPLSSFCVGVGRGSHRHTPYKCASGACARRRRICRNLSRRSRRVGTGGAIQVGP